MKGMIDMSKILYFERAGMDFDPSRQEYGVEPTDIGNYRIRTAFRNNFGKQIYLELTSGTYIETIKIGKRGQPLKHPKEIRHPFRLHVSYAFDIELGENESPILITWNETKELPFTKRNVLNLVNEKLDCDFDSVVTLPMFSGYRVHDGQDGYNLMDNHIDIPARTTERNRIYKEVAKEYFEPIYRQHIESDPSIKHLTSKYESWSVVSMDDSTMTLRSYACKELIDDDQREKTFDVIY